MAIRSVSSSLCFLFAVEVGGALLRGMSSVSRRSPGAGVNLEALEPYKVIYKDGYLLTGCIKDSLLAEGDKFGDGEFSYRLGPIANVSIVHYTQLVAKEDRKAMTPKVCFEFCRTLPNMSFFGLTNGRGCYCAPYFHQIAGDSSSCDAVCDGDNTQMCGGKFKSSVYEMHACNDADANLKAAQSKGIAESKQLQEASALVAQASKEMQSSAEKLQVSFGMVGDVEAAALCQTAKVFAGELEHKAEGGSEQASKLQGLVASVDVHSGSVTSTEKLTAKLLDGSTSAAKMTSGLDELGKTAVTPDASGSAKLYYPAMYFVDKDFVDMPATCSGAPAGDPIVGSYRGCAEACELAVGKCVGFTYLGDDQSGLCFLLAGFRTIMYYTGCASGAPAAALLQRSGNRASLQMARSSWVKLQDWKLCSASVHSNLGGMGPDSGEKALRFIGVGEGVDLLIVNTSEYKPKKSANNKLKVCLGMLNTLAGTEVTLQFRFVASGTHEKVSDAFHGSYLSFFDVDEGSGGSREYVKVPDATDYSLGTNSTIQVVDLQGYGIKFIGTSVQSGGSQNPEDPLTLTDDQANKAFTVKMLTSEFSVTIGSLDGAFAGTGRNFFFSGRSALIENPVVQEGETKCMAKFSRFESTTLRPDPMGRCKNCFKEAQKADRCFK